MGRKDDQELDRLEATCPRRRYDAQDYEYTRRKQRFCQLAFMTAIRHLEESAHNAGDCCRVGIRDRRRRTRGGSGSASGSIQEAHAGVSTWEVRPGWLRFCERLGVNPDAMTAPFTEHVERAMDFAESVSEVLHEENADHPKSAEAIATRELDGLLDAWGDSDVAARAMRKRGGGSEADRRMTESDGIARQRQLRLRRLT